MIKIGIDCYDQTVGIDGYVQATCLMTEVADEINVGLRMPIVENFNGF